MLAGSFPEPSLRMPVTARRRWFAGYVEQMITRDVPAVAPRRDPELLRRYLTGGAFAAGIVLHAGPHVFPLSDRIIAAPVSALWS